MKRINAMFLAVLMLLSVIAPSVQTEAATKSLSASEKAFLKEMREFDYKGMNKYVKDWGENGQVIPALYEVPQGKKYFAKCAKKMTCKVVSVKKKGKVADVKVRIRYIDSEDFTLNFCVNAFYYMASGKLDQLDTMTDKETIKLMNGIIKEAQKSTSMKHYRTQTVKIRFVKTKSCWKVQKVSNKLANIMTANFIYNLEKMSTMDAMCISEDRDLLPCTVDLTSRNVWAGILRKIYPAQ